MKKTIYNDLTNLFELSKTLRFELIPTKKTKWLLEKNKVIQKDEKIQQRYLDIKYYLDKLHCEFINKSLNEAKLDLYNYYKIYKKTKKDKKYNKDLTSIENKLRKQIKKLFDEKANEWKKDLEHKKIEIKKNGLEILFDKNNLLILKDKFKEKPNDDHEAPNIIIKENNKNINLFDSFKGFTTYFINFNESRRNFYSEKDQNTSIPNRSINDNLPRFCNNKFLFENIIKNSELKLNQEEVNIFDLDYYNSCLTQKGINKYNEIIGGLVENKEKIQGINEKINEFNQKNKAEIPYLKILYKQILGKKQSDNAFIEILNDDQLLEVLKKAYKHINRKINFSKQIFLKNLLGNYDLGKIYISKKAQNTLSSKYFEDNNLLFVKPDKLDFISLGQIKKYLDSIGDINDQNNFISFDNLYKDKYEKILSKQNNHFHSFITILKNEFSECIKRYEKSKNNIEKLIKNNKFIKNEDKINTIREFFERSLNIYQITKYFLLEKKGKKIEPENGTEEKFYNEYNKYYEDYKIIPYLNTIRNYLTKKPFSIYKIKLNFEKGNLLGGWADSPEGNTQYYGLIFKTIKNNYYLGISEKSRIFDYNKHPEAFKTEYPEFYKMKYQQIKTQTILGSNYKEKYKNSYKDDKKNLKSKILIDRIKKILESKIDTYPQFKSIINKKYNDPKDISTDLNKLLFYKISFVPINKDYLKQSLENDLYLFKIYNKDFSKYSKGKDNIHTKYFKYLFDKDNLYLPKPVLKLSGGAEVFYRPKTNNFIKSKDKNNKEIIKNKRYSADKYFLHLPININPSDKIYYNEYNLKIRSLILKNLNNINIIGIDRGEKHLTYYSVIDKKEKILKIGSLNNPLGKTDYNQLLENKEIERKQDRKRWQAINQIKDIKSGYISQVIRKICDLILKYNAIVIFEDLNYGFKTSRSKIEKQVYQNLEKALINKLNYLVNKDAKLNESGHYLKGYQLAPIPKSFTNVGKQCGIIFYTTASYTSTTCPKCGFRKNLDTKFNGIKKTIELFKNIDIKYNKKFILTCNQEKINKKWILKTDVDRFYNKKDEKTKKWNTEKYNINVKLKELFEKNKIDVSKNINKQIKNNKLPQDFYKSLMFYLKLLLQIRNSYSEKNIDYISCPACGFHSNHRFQNKEFNGDANGAYNIARKGIIILNRIKKKIEKPNMLVNIENWDKFVTKK